jgi:hypothetical protein
MSKDEEYAEDTSARQAASRALLASCLAYSSAVKMQVTCSSETSVDFQSQKMELLINK